MANPNIVSCTADTWNAIATNVTAGQVWIKDTGVQYLHTYRMTGDPAPTTLTDALDFLGLRMAIDSATAIDVYLYPLGANGSVRVDL